MNVKERILALKLLEKQRKTQSDFKGLGLEIKIKTKEEKPNTHLQL